MTQEIRITQARKIVVQKKLWNGEETLDIRTFIECKDYTGFTKKGVNIPVAKASELQAAISQVLKEQVSEEA
jgi:hypothetical protein